MSLALGCIHCFEDNEGWATCDYYGKITTCSSECEYYNNGINKENKKETDYKDE